MKQFKGIEIQVVPGDITNVPADVLLTKINDDSGRLGIWTDNICKRIQETSGDVFFEQLDGPIKDGRILFASGNAEKTCVYNNVLFIVSNSATHINEYLLQALRIADAKKMTSVSIPALFTCKFYDEIGESANQVILTQLLAAVTKFAVSAPVYLKKVIFVIHDNEKSFEYMQTSVNALQKSSKTVRNRRSRLDDPDDHFDHCSDFGSLSDEDDHFDRCSEFG